MPSKGYRGRRDFNSKIQAVAVSKGLYAQAWPNYRMQPIDSLPGELAKTIDIGGGDMCLFANDGHLVFVGHRFRKHSILERGFIDLTIREAEYKRHMAAVHNGGFLPDYYACGYANKKEDDIVEFIIVNYNRFMNDIYADQMQMEFKDCSFLEQENFYYIAFDKIPDCYVVFRLETAASTQGSWLF